jgi:hypothetical protein
VTLSSNRVPTTDLQPMAELAADLTIIGNPIGLKNFEHFSLYERTAPEVSQFYASRLFSWGMSVVGEFSDIKWLQAWIRLNALNLNAPDDLLEKAAGPGLR